MPAARLPDPSQLSRADDKDVYNVVAQLFEDSDELRSFVTPLLRDLSEPTYARWIDLVREQLKLYARPQESHNAQNMRGLDAILNAHPRLGEKKANLSDASAAEQANLQSGTNHAEELELQRLNAEYETRFNGLRYLVFVNGRQRPEIFKDMRRRIERNDSWVERIEAIDALCDIALDRSEKMSITTD